MVVKRIKRFVSECLDRHKIDDCGGDDPSIFDDLCDNITVIFYDEFQKFKEQTETKVRNYYDKTNQKNIS